MGKSTTRGMVMGGIAIALGIINVTTQTEAPSAGVQVLTYVLFALGAIGFFGSLVIYLKQKGQS